MSGIMFAGTGGRAGLPVFAPLIGGFIPLMAQCSDVCDFLGSGICPGFLEGCGVGGLAHFITGGRSGDLRGHSAFCSFLCAAVAGTGGGAGPAVFTPVIGGLIPGVAGGRHILAADGLDLCPFSRKDGGVGGPALFGAGGRCRNFRCYCGSCHFSVRRISPADAFCNTDAAVGAPVVADSPVMTQSSNVCSCGGLGLCPVFTERCFISGNALLRAGGRCSNDALCCCFSLLDMSGIMFAGTCGRAGLAVLAPLIGGFVPLMVQCRNHNGIGLCLRPGLAEAGLVGDFSIFLAGSRLCNFFCYKCAGCSRFLAAISQASAGCSAFGVFVVPLIDDFAPFMAQGSKISNGLFLCLCPVSVSGKCCCVGGFTLFCAGGLLFDITGNGTDDCFPVGGIRLADTNRNADTAIGTPAIAGFAPVMTGGLNFDPGFQIVNFHCSVLVCEILSAGTAGPVGLPAGFGAGGCLGGVGHQVVLSGGAGNMPGNVAAVIQLGAVVPAGGAVRKDGDPGEAVLCDGRCSLGRKYQFIQIAAACEGPASDGFQGVRECHDAGEACAFKGPVRNGSEMGRELQLSVECQLCRLRRSFDADYIPVLDGIRQDQVAVELALVAGDVNSVLTDFIAEDKVRTFHIGDAGMVLGIGFFQHGELCKGIVFVCIIAVFALVV